MKQIKLLIAGGRDFNDYELLKTWCNAVSKNYKILEIISGTAKGADTLGEVYAKEHNIPIKRFPADWETYGKKAGYLRNVEMGNYCDNALIFWDGESKGTKHMIGIMNKLNKKYKVVSYSNKLIKK